MKRSIAGFVALTAVLALSGCVAVPEVAAPSTAPFPASSTAPETEAASEPHGTWQLSPGLPDGIPADLPLPADRWIEDRSTPFDDSDSVGMVELWVTADEVDEVILELEGAGWIFGEPTEGAFGWSQVAFKDDQTKSLNIGFRPEDSERDSQLTVTYTAGLPGK